ncbi:MAG TPA: dihydroneopterin aldolase [Acidimicrobiales bacterium]|nr:dihydroneopterin aldolase [Acidimicrobiales bacterium]
MSDDRIELRGLRVLARCGVGDGERSAPQPLEIDLDVTLDLRPAGSSDDLDDTVDYGNLSDVVAATMAEPAALLEHLAGRVADAVLAADERIDATVVVLRKLRPPVPHHLTSAGVRITRGRAS